MRAIARAHSECLECRIFRYTLIGLALHVAVTILQLPATLRAAQNAGEELCVLMRHHNLWYFTGSGSFFGLSRWPLSLEHELHELAPRLAQSCFVRAYPVGGLRSFLLGDVELEIGRENPPEGLVLEVRHHLFWQGLVKYVTFDERWYRIGLTVIGHRRWQWTEAGVEGDGRRPPEPPIM